MKGGAFKSGKVLLGTHISKKRKFAIGYCLLLLVSRIWTATHPHEPPLPAGMQSEWLAVQIANGPTAGSVKLAYRDTAPGRADLPVVVMIHVSPGSSEVLEKLTGLLPSRFRLIVPDLPGFGDSSRDVPDYSFHAHARYLIALLDRLHIARAQFLGFSMGGGVILSIFVLDPARVQSLVMLSAIGVQEQSCLEATPGTISCTACNWER